MFSSPENCLSEMITIQHVKLFFLTKSSKRFASSKTTSHSKKLTFVKPPLQWSLAWEKLTITMAAGTGVSKSESKYSNPLAGTLVHLWTPPSFPYTYRSTLHKTAFLNSSHSTFFETNYHHGRILYHWTCWCGPYGESCYCPSWDRYHHLPSCSLYTSLFLEMIKAFN